MKFGLTDQQYQSITEQVAQPLIGLNAKVFCFGSRARGTHQVFSDLDLMIESESDLTKEVGQIKEILSTSNFPYKVDIVQLRDFAQSYMENYQREKVIW